MPPIKKYVLEMTLVDEEGNKEVVNSFTNLRRVVLAVDYQEEVDRLTARIKELENQVKGDVIVMKPVKVSGMDLALGISDIDKYLPKWEEIPEEFKKGYGEAQKWVKISNDIFYSGVKITEVVTKEGIDKKEAIQHVMGVLRSFEPKHEHKMAGVAYLMSLWFEKFMYVKGE